LHAPAAQFRVGLANLFGTEVINAGSRLASIDAKVAGATL